jgi:cytochrome P450
VSQTPDQCVSSDQNSLALFFVPLLLKGHLLQEHGGVPGRGIVGRLREAERTHRQVAGRPLSERDLLGYLFSLLFAGHHTTATGLGDLLVAIVEHDLAGRLVADPTLIPKVAEESLRLSPTFPNIPMYALADLRLGEVDIAGGQAVEVSLADANRDPREFPEPNTFIADRAPNRHLAYGLGAHLCLGVNLARLELRVAVAAFLHIVPRPLALDAELPPLHRQGFVTTLTRAAVTYPRG